MRTGNCTTPIATWTPSGPRAIARWKPGGGFTRLYVNGRRGGEAEKEAQAREQYFRFQEEVETALGGRQLDHGRYESFRGTGGVQSTERRLRRLMGIPISDGSLLRPVDEPMLAKVVFDWNEVLVETLARRAELRRQQWRIKRGELQLAATRNFLLPRLDAVGRYRWRGLGHDLLDPNSDSPDRFDNAYGNLTGGDFQEWQLGVECTAPLGFRQGHVAVRNAELLLARERSILEEQKREIVHDLSAAFADVDRTYVVSQTNYNRQLAAREQLRALEAVYEDADENEKTRLLDLLLDAQRRLADAESQYYRSRIEYTLGGQRRPSAERLAAGLQRSLPGRGALAGEGVSGRLPARAAAVGAAGPERLPHGARPRRQPRPVCAGYRGFGARGRHAHPGGIRAARRRRFLRRSQRRLRRCRVRPP